MIGILILLALTLVGNSYADPRQWDTEGVAVRAMGIVDEYSTASRDDGTTLVVWSQSQGREPVVMGQLISASGTVMWADSGIMVAQGNRRAGTPIAVAVGFEWVILWLDATLVAGSEPTLGWSGNGSMRIIRIDDNGNPVWGGGRSGQEIVPYAEGWGLMPFSLHASGTGVIVSWNLTSVDHWAQKYDAAGQAVWPQAVPIRGLISTYSLDVAPDLEDGILFMWTRYTGGNNVLRVNRLSSEGELLWNDTSGVVVKTTTSQFHLTEVTADGVGGAYVAWKINNVTDSVRAQRISPAGQLLWPEVGSAIASGGDYTATLTLQTSFSGGGVGGVIALVLEAGAIDSARLIAQRLSLAGVPQWSEDESRVCVGAYTEFYIDYNSIISDQRGGALCYFTKQRSNNPQHSEPTVVAIRSDGLHTWNEECGISAASAAYYSSATPPVLSDDAVQIFWLEKNFATARSVRTQRMLLDDGELVYDDPILVATGDSYGVNNVEAVALLNGSTAVAWAEWTNGVETMKFQILDVFGEPLFGPAGRPLAVDDSGLPMRGESCSLCPDGSGGFFATFRGLEQGVLRFRAVHLNDRGEHISDPNGIMFMGDPTEYMDGQDSYCISDGHGGCIVSVVVFDNTYMLNSVVYRLDSQCQPVWDNSIVYNDESRDVFSLVVVPRGPNAFIVVYSPYAFDDAIIRAAGISLDGVQLWNTEIDSGAFGYDYNDVAVCSDAANGCYVIWNKRRANVYETHVQRVLPTGELSWTTEGLVFTDSIASSSDFSCGVDALGNLTYAWRSSYSNDTNIHGQRIARDGTVLWPADGLALSLADNDQWSPKVVVLSDNEVYVAWNDSRNAIGNSSWQGDIYGTHLDARGQIRDDSYWQEGGSAICDHAYGQTRLELIADGAGGAVAVWYDVRSSQDFEPSVFAQRLYDPIFTDADDVPVVPTELSLSQNYPNPFNPETVIEFALPNASKTTLNVFDVTGRHVTTLIDEPLTAGIHRTNFDAARLPSGIYFYTLRADHQSMTRKMVLLR